MASIRRKEYLLLRDANSLLDSRNRERRRALQFDDDILSPRLDCHPVADR
jgi:hypothetical protein